MDRWEDRLKRGFDMLIVPHTPLQLPQEEEKMPDKRPSRYARLGGRIVKVGFTAAAALFVALFALVEPVREWGLSFFSFEFAYPADPVTSWAPSPWTDFPSPSPYTGPTAIYPSPSPLHITGVEDLFDIYTVEIPAGFAFCNLTREYITDGETAYRVGRGELIPVETARLTDTPEFLGRPVVIDWLYTVQDGDFIPLEAYGGETAYPLRMPGTGLIWVAAPFDHGAVFLQYDRETGAIRDVVEEAIPGIMASWQKCTVSPDQTMLAVIYDGQAYLIDAETAAPTPLKVDVTEDTRCYLIDNATLLFYDYKAGGRIDAQTYSIRSKRVTRSIQNAPGQIFGIHTLRLRDTLYNLKTGQSIILEGLLDGIRSCAYSPDMSRIIVLGGSRMMGYIDTETMEIFYLDHSPETGGTFFWLTDTVLAAGQGTQWTLFELKD